MKQAILAPLLALPLLGCGESNASVVITDVSGTAAVTAGEYEVDADLSTSHSFHRLVIVLEDDDGEDCTALTASFCESFDSTTLSPPQADWSCGSGSGDMFQPNAFTLSLTVSCDDGFAQWRNSSGDATIERVDDEIRFRFDGKLDPQGTTPGSLVLSLDALVSK